MDLTDTETVTLVDTIDQAIEGHKDSKQLAMADRNFKELESMLEYQADTDETIAILESIKRKALSDAGGE